MRIFIPLKKGYIFVSLFFLIIILIITSTKIGKNIYAGIIKNIANRKILLSYINNEHQCDSLDQSESINLYQYSLEINPESMLTWRNLTFEKGLRDREWLVNQIKLWSDQGKDQWIDQLILDFDIPPWGIQIEWSNERCLLEWKAFTVGLIYATQGKWQEAVTYYQIGIALSPGEIRSDIIAEYYSTLANYTISKENSQPSDQLAAAKYFALAGNQEKAQSIFDGLINTKNVSEYQRCEAVLGYQWVTDGDMQIKSIPWPAYLGESDECLTEPGNEIKPEWLFEDNRSYTDADGRVLVGFDTDEDFLNAGVEIIGKFYWKTSYGDIFVEPFRQVNLWPNSGNNWLPNKKIWQCLPGYYEAAWVYPCASQIISERNNEGDFFGDLVEKEPEGPDSNLLTATKWIPKNKIIISGGKWKITGDLVNPQIPKEFKSGIPSRYYDVIINLSDYPNEIWFSRLGKVDALTSDYEYSFWIRPRMGKGKGNIDFDNIFLFLLTEN